MNETRPTTHGVLRHRDDVLKEVIQIVAEQMAVQPERIRDGDSLVGDIGCDSLDIVEISMEIEEHFDVSVPDELAEKARTIGEVTDGVLELLSRSGAD